MEDYSEGPGSGNAQSPPPKNSEGPPKKPKADALGDYVEVQADKGKMAEAGSTQPRQTP